MPNQTTSRVVLDGPRRVTMHFTGIGDGSGIQETNVVKVNVAGLNPPGGARTKVRAIKYDVTGVGVVVLSWDGASPTPFLTLSGSADHVDYSDFGGLHDDNPNPTGNILLSTLGFDVGSVYNITLDLIKVAVGS
jgi:hypothetical protein